MDGTNNEFYMPGLGQGELKCLKCLKFEFKIEGQALGRGSLQFTDNSEIGVNQIFGIVKVNSQ